MAAAGHAFEDRQNRAGESDADDRTGLFTQDSVDYEGSSTSEMSWPESRGQVIFCRTISSRMFAA